MSKKYNTKKTLHRQINAQQTAPNSSDIVKHLWLSGDSCAPIDLPKEEIQARLETHVAHLGELMPSAPDYERQVLFVHMYHSILRNL